MKDPVCGMDVGEKGDSLEYRGKQYRFCCASCRWVFEQNPDQFTKSWKCKFLPLMDAQIVLFLKRCLDQLGIRYDLIDVTEKPEYLEKYPIFATGLVIDGKLEFTGIPKKDLEKKFS